MTSDSTAGSGVDQEGSTASTDDARGATVPTAFDNVRGYLGRWRDAERQAETHRMWVMMALHALREKSGLTLRSAARAAKMSAPSLSLAERGELHLSWDTAARLVEALESATGSRAGAPVLAVDRSIDCAVTPPVEESHK